MAHGYETQLTPLQMLTFYNAVANNGKMMRPRICVSGIWSHGTQIKNFPPEVLVESIAKPSTIRAEVCWKVSSSMGQPKNIKMNCILLPVKRARLVWTMAGEKR